MAPDAGAGMTYEHGLVLGKFYPPHAGHHHLIRTASEHCRRLTVLVEAASVESMSAMRSLPRTNIASVMPSIE